MKSTKPPSPGKASTGDGGDSGGGNERSLSLGKSKIKETRLRLSGYRKIMTLARDGKRFVSGGRNSKAKARSVGSQWQPKISRQNVQRVSVRLTYAKNRADGTWRAHGRYLEREAATGRDGDGRGFGHEGEGMPIAKTLDEWQKAEDRNLFKLILSPEHGDRLDLREYTAAYIAELEKQLGTKLQWVAADHHNTEHPHVHVAVRGVDERGAALVIPREFIKGPLRAIAQDLATRRLGHRTEMDVREEREAQVKQHRFTDLDRMLLKQARAGQGGAPTLDFGTPVAGTAKQGTKDLRLLLLKRLATLESLGLAERGQGGSWQLDPATETILRERQKANDRLKVAFSHRAMASDPRIPLAPAPAGDARIAGRLIGTGLDDASGKAYMLVETVGGSMVYLYQTRSAEIARGEGLKPGDFLVITQRQREDGEGGTRLSQTVRRVGTGEEVLTNAKAMREEIRHHVRASGTLPIPSTWGGWLGTFHGELHKQAQGLVAQGVIRPNGARHEFIESTRPPVRPRGPGRS